MSKVTTLPLSGLRMLVAEDNRLIAMLVAQTLGDLGCTVVGPFDNLDQTLHAIRTGDLDGALLDIQLGETDVSPAAHQLAQRGVPFILATGRGRHGLPAPLAEAPLLTKPFDAEQLEELVKSTFRRRVRPLTP